MLSDVLIVAPRHDIHAVAVKARLDALGKTCMIDDLSWAGESQYLDASFSSDGCLLSFGEFSVSERTAVWWRRNALPLVDASKVDQKAFDFVAREKKNGLYGSLYAIGCPIINSPFAEQRANYKPVQLALCRQLGIRFPETCITNSAEVAARFIESLENRGKEAVYKPFTPSELHLAETRKVTAQEVRLNSESLELAPVIFQEFIEREKDLRIFCTKDEFCIVECISKHDLVDWRLDPLVEYVRVDGEWNELRTTLVSMLEGLGLHSGSFDVRVNPQGETVFLEVNPSGQFLFMETDTDWPVSQIMADLLLSQVEQPLNQYESGLHSNSTGNEVAHVY